MAIYIRFIAMIFVACCMDMSSASGQVFITQYYEGSSNDRWIEIHNAGSNSVNLGDGNYRVGMWTNTRRGDWKSNYPPDYSATLTGSISPHGTYLIGHGQAVAPSYAVANQTASSVCSFTGDDTVVLYRGLPFSTSNIVDSIGVYTNQLADISISRKAYVIKGNTSTTDYVASDWNTYSIAAVDNASPGDPAWLGCPPIPPCPDAPTEVSASDETHSDRIRVQWITSTLATGYEVWRNTTNDSGSAARVCWNIVLSPYDDMTAFRGITYYYWVRATNLGGASPFSSSDSGLRASIPLTISGTVSYGGSQTGGVNILLSPYFIGQSNIALSLDGGDDAMVVTNPTTILRLTNTHSFCAWINLKAMPAGNQSTILMKYSDTNRASYVASVEKTTGRLRYSIGDSDTIYSTSTISIVSGWIHIAFTHDGSVGRWYINGALDSSKTFQSLRRWGDGPLYIGRSIDDLQTDFDKYGGEIDEVSLWNKSLNQPEIQALMTNTLTGSETGLAGYWNFNDETGADLTTNSNDGLFIHGATTTMRQAGGIARTITLVSPGGYIITNVLASTYDLCAYLDSSGNGSNDPWEVRGHYLGNPLSVTGAMSGIDIALHDPMADDDLDRLSDYDEVYVYGSSWTNSDSDDDGMPDGDEVLAGSSPTNNASVFGFADSQPVPDGGGVVVSWPSLSNRIYRLERSTNLLLGFEPYADGIPADPPVNSYTDDTPNVLGAYKVGVRME